MFKRATALLLAGNAQCGCGCTLQCVLLAELRASQRRLLFAGLQGWGFQVVESGGALIATVAIILVYRRERTKTGPRIALAVFRAALVALVAAVLTRFSFLFSGVRLSFV